MTRALVVGSVNVDLVVRVAHLPAPGATVVGGELARYAGGKGGNQAAALARLGARTALVAAVGDDAGGRWSVEQLAAAGVDTAGVLRVEGAATGTAFVAVDAGGDNLIVVSPGANAQCPPPAEVSADVVVVQLEVPVATVLQSLRAARAAGARTVLNAAPPAALPAELWPLVDLLVVNEAEAVAFGRDLPVGATVVTMGAGGAAVVVAGRTVTVPAPAVDVVDTTGAGDCFTAAAALACAEGADPVQAARFAVAAAALSVTGAGARSHPAREAVADLVQKESERNQASS